MTKLIFFIAGLLVAESASARIEISVVDTPYRVTVRFDDEVLKPAQRLLVTSRFDRSITGYLLLLSVDPRTHLAMAKVISHEKNALMLVGDTAILVDYHADEPNVPGRADLMESDGKGIPIRYRPLFYLGQGPSESAQTLHPGENALAIETYYSRGITERLTLSTIGVVDALGLPTLGAKFRVYDSDDVVTSIGGLAVYHPSEGAWAEIYNGYLDVRSNSKFISHNQITIYSSNIHYKALSDEVTIARPVQGSYLRSLNEYILDSWDRILFGPAYNFDRKTLGGIVLYVFLWDHLQVMGGVATEDFSNFNVTRYGYQPRLGLFWLF